jgi:hypothetical protein
MADGIEREKKVPNATAIMTTTTKISADAAMAAANGVATGEATDIAKAAAMVRARDAAIPACRVGATTASSGRTTMIVERTIQVTIRDMAVAGLAASTAGDRRPAAISVYSRYSTRIIWQSKHIL